MKKPQPWPTPLAGLRARDMTVDQEARAARFAAVSGCSLEEARGLVLWSIWTWGNLRRCMELGR